MGLGLFFLSLGTRLISAATVGLISQLEIVLGPLWVWLAGIERPSVPTIAGGVIVIGAVALTITGEHDVTAAGLSPGELADPIGADACARIVPD